MRRALASAALLLGIPLFASAQPQVRSWNWEASASLNETGEGSRQALQGVLPFTGRFGLRFLLGEPVVSCSASLGNSADLVVTVPGERALTWRWEAAAPGEFEVYSLLVAAMMDEPGARTWNGSTTSKLVVYCDAGIVAQSGRPGFNVAGSPNWDELFCAANQTSVALQRQFGSKGDPCAAAGGRWLSADEARKVVKGGVDFRGFEIASLEVSASGVIKRVEKKRWRDTSVQYRLKRLDAISAGSPGDAFTQVVLDTRKQAGRVILAGDVDDADLRRFDEWFAALLRDYPQGAEWSTRWQSAERDLVGEQLDRVTVVDKEVRRQEAALTDYRRRLDQLASRAPKETEEKGPQGPKEILAAARQTSISEFWEGRLVGFKSPTGQVLLPPTYSGICGKFGGLACVRDASGRRSLVDGYGRVLVPPHDAEILVNNRILDCAGAVVLRRGEEYASELTLYSLEEQRNLFDWLPFGGFDSLLHSTATCEDGFDLIRAVGIFGETCGRRELEEVRVRHSFDGRAIGAPRTRRDRIGEFCR